MGDGTVVTDLTPGTGEPTGGPAADGGEVTHVVDSWDVFVVEYKRPGVEWRAFRFGEFDTTDEAADFIAKISVDVPKRIVRCVGSLTETRTVVPMPPAPAATPTGDVETGEHVDG